MAKGRKCPSCKNPMYAETEKYLPAGTEIVYVCRANGGACSHKEKVFEDN